ncbi:UDP-N-acetylglucosamine--N-acetylmuramyl-(pentapeptide) pyrophosphoryl-undecaprenol N-acetylglucosamine transferase [Candidatus Daviesbacteria bacterium]|nr:UDP-N-acetylglucosamine--N-acetylmuramyl-(pentapeptide) pyrophosphoryl-undecaprenol N-acetylglucosamine transferase [Candidatus Daviesbacteria bacterium]
MKVLLTGAHFTPAIAVIEELKKNSDVKLIYVGRKTTLEGDKTASVESKVLPSLGIKFIPITTGRLLRVFSIYTISSILKIPVGFFQAFYIILSEKPDVILSFGGYVAIPIIIIGWFFSIPIIIHEQTLVIGLANKISSLFADKIAVSFSRHSKSEKNILTGNPLRKEILKPIEKLPSDFIQLFNQAKKLSLPVILVMGGNQGSHLINTCLENALEELIKIACVIHVSGSNKFGDYERLNEFRKINQIKEKYLVKHWIGEEFGTILKKADLVVCRAGINTLIESAFSEVPSLVIPIPYLYQDEQSKNAKFFQMLGVSEILHQSNLSPKTLVKNIKLMLDNLNNFRDNFDKTKEFIITDAAKRLALETLLLGSKKL